MRGANVWSFVLLLFGVMSSLLEAGQLSSCTEDDVCSSIIFNQLAIATVQEHVMELMQTLNHTRNSGQMVPKEALDSCLTANKHLQTQITRNVISLIPQHHPPQHPEKDQLRRQVENLTRSRQGLQEENKLLQQAIVEKDEEIRNLILLTYLPEDCADIQLQGRTESGIYTIYPYHSEDLAEVVCDLDSNGGGWTVFFTRQPQDEPLDFNESWEKFKNGFGNVNTEYWLGNELVHQMTADGDFTLRVDAENFSGERRWGEWNIFNVGDEDSKYELTLEDYDVSSTIGDSLSKNSNASFTTFDSDNDHRRDMNCALGSTYANWGKGGWWYKGCGSARPTAPLKNSSYWDSASWKNWDPEGTSIASLKILSMKFRRHSYEELTAPRE